MLTTNTTRRSRWQIRNTLSGSGRAYKEWNQWRWDHPEIRPNLEGVHFHDYILTDASLADAGTGLLSIANLSSANLSNAHLEGVNLCDVNFRGANMSGANLFGSILCYAHFDEADLCEANLENAYLHSAILERANFTIVHFNRTAFSRVNLDSVKGLETAIHEGPSMVDIKSVKLPYDEYTRTHFLRGVGFTETQIEYLPSLLTPQPIEYASLFISYAHQDEAIAKRFYTNLREKDVPCWMALHDLQPGNYFRERIDQAIHSQDKLLLLLSEYSVKSGWVRYEVEQAMARENRQQKEILFPIRLDNAIFDCRASWAASLRETRHIGDFTNWSDEAFYQQAFSTLLRHLKVGNLLVL